MTADEPAFDPTRKFSERRAYPSMSGAPCGAWGGCVLPAGHNMGRVDIPENHLPAPVSAADLLPRAIRTVLPALLIRNYVDRWATGSPAVQALSVLSEFVGEGPVQAGETIDAAPAAPVTEQPVTPAREVVLLRSENEYLRIREAMMRAERDSANAKVAAVYDLIGPGRRMAHLHDGGRYFEEKDIRAALATSEAPRD